MKDELDTASRAHRQTACEKIIVGLDVDASNFVTQESLEIEGYHVLVCRPDMELLHADGFDQMACLILSSKVLDRDPSLIRMVLARNPSALIIMMVESGDVRNAVRAMREGCFEVLENLSAGAASLQHIFEAMRMNRRRDFLPPSRHEAMRRLSLLTPRQVQVLERVLLGQPSKVIASDLSISQRTVENHRACIMTKTGSGSLPALTRLAVTADGHIPPLPARSRPRSEPSAIR